MMVMFFFLQTLLLNTTNLLCDCNVNWLLDRLENSLYKDVYMACSFPVQFRGKELRHLHKNDLSCSKLLIIYT